ncbi:protein of unknown function [Sinosporangium album]|uniref:DUF4276 family protein n=1 Tax=Sinosporangium album TaxID=504805 RepID=A0A1G7T1Q4_9ACTN|nr:DUF4276 family protein [Sinosporangium album]SDG28599.1 protein of unknown function [Sinosporangium album]
MRRLHILCEGQTEESIAREVISPYFMNSTIYVTWSVHTTKRPAGGPSYKGGLSTWKKLVTEIRLLLQDPSITLLSTLFDYYGLPSDVPGMRTRPIGSPYDRVAHVERAMAEAVHDRRFLPHLVLHEVEAWVLAGHDALGDLLGDRPLSQVVQRIVMEAHGAELVNEGPETAPSKRLLNLIPRYRKTLDGPLVIADFGVDGVRKTCPHADAWFSALSDALEAPRS